MPVISGTTKILGLLGDGIAYSLSPAIHNFSIQHLGLDQVYLPFDLPPQNLAAAVETLWAIGSPGFNITQPYKSLVSNHIQCSNLASVNTAVRGPTGFIGHSTDGIGFDKGLQQLGLKLQGLRKIVILGGGGAAIGILTYLQAIGFTGEIVVLTRASAAPPAISLKRKMGALSVNQLKTEISGLGRECLVIQATSAPHKGDDLSWLCPALDDFLGALIDICYGKVSALLAAAKAKGLPAQDGIPMLIEQARESQILWWGKAAPYLEIRTALKLA